MKRKINLLIIAAAGLLMQTCTPDNSKAIAETYINKGWTLFSSENLKADGPVISSQNFDPQEGYKVNLPATVLSGLRQNGLFPDIYHDMALKRIDNSLFKAPWWYRREIHIDQTDANIHHQLILEGINYKATLWINGREVSVDRPLEGVFGIYSIDVTPFVEKGSNTIAIKIAPPVHGDLTLGFVDWNPEAPDKNMGLWRGVRLKSTGPVVISHSNVRSNVNTETLDKASLIFSVIATNLSGQEQETVIRAKFPDAEISKTTKLQPGEEREIIFSPDQYDALNIENPELWWPNNMGDQHLHNLTVTASVNHLLSDREESRYGIRQVEDFRTDEGHRGFKVNGEKVLITGGGWVDDMLLADSDEKVKAQIDYVKHMNMNTIRLEGFWGKNNTLYNYCDEQGIMLMIGWSCQWEWEDYCGRPEGEFMSIYPEEYEREATAYRQQVLRARNHPAIFLWTYGSDRLPHPDLEKILNDHMTEIDPQTPIVTTCRGIEVDGHPNTSSISGPSGVKMLGPYGYVSPNYWYVDTLYGGAYGFNTETGPGPQVPPIESIKKMLPENHLWPIDTVWHYHYGRKEFGTLNRYLKAFNARYGEADNLEDFTFKSQVSNYEAIRGMFEAFAVNKYESTGVIQWMLNSAWPEMFWQLYDYYLRPNGAFYGTRKACSPLMAIYNYKDKNIYVNNNHLKAFDNLKLSIKVLDENSHILFSEETPFGIESNHANLIFEMPEINGLSTTYFLDLRIHGPKGEELANNFYWLSTQEDKPDFEATTWFYTPAVEFADLKGINHLEAVEVALNVDHEIRQEEIIYHCKLSNPTDHLAFFTEVKILNKETGEAFLPVFWSDNYISLLPGESRKISAKISAKNTSPDQLKIVMKGINVPEKTFNKK
jgi:exo-1,4-beta-D-glucosaminidase